jgi:PEP-CTERM motif
MKIYRNALLASAALLAMGLGQPASADPVRLNPRASNGTYGSINGAMGFNTDGGTGVAYQNMYIETQTQTGPDSSTGTGLNQSYETDVVINITGFSNGGVGISNTTTDIGVSWSLFAVVSLTGLGNWDGSNDFTATSANMSMQIYAQKSVITGENNPTNNVGGFNLITPNGGSTLTTTQLGTLGLHSTGGAGNEGCFDGSNSTGANCILLASSTSTDASLTVDGAANSNDHETMSLTGVLDPLSYAIGVAPNGFFNIPTSLTMLLTVDSGAGSGGLGATPIIVANDEGEPTIGYTTGNCDGPPSANTSSCGQNVNWAIDVPEPASLPLLGTALAFVGAAARRRRKARS